MKIHRENEGFPVGKRFEKIEKVVDKRKRL